VLSLVTNIVANKPYPSAEAAVAAEVDPDAPPFVIDEDEAASHQEVRPLPPCYPNSQTLCSSLHSTDNLPPVHYSPQVLDASAARANDMRALVEELVNATILV